VSTADVPLAGDSPLAVDGPPTAGALASGALPADGGALAEVRALAAAPPEAGAPPGAGGVLVGSAAGWVPPPPPVAAGAGAFPRTAPVTALAAELTADPAVLVTAPTAPLSEPEWAEEGFAEPPGALAGAATAALAAGTAPGDSSPAAAWACLENSRRRKTIPAAAIANCAARTATRYASSRDIDSSHPQRNRTARADGGQESPGSAARDR
jgi:hypothetical protein